MATYNGKVLKEKTTKYKTEPVDIEVTEPHTQQTGDEADEAHSESPPDIDKLDDNNGPDSWKRAMEKINTIETMKKSGRFQELERLMHKEKHPLGTHFQDYIENKKKGTL